MQYNIIHCLYDKRQVWLDWTGLDNTFMNTTQRQQHVAITVDVHRVVVVVSVAKNYIEVAWRDTKLFYGCFSELEKWPNLSPTLTLVSLPHSKNLS